ncbi:hydrolase 1, exosortase A system-associated [Oxalobacteraceae sp. CFBP 8763]|nr:hydrolase 1, exosortase A system-associated [Oxalobacteraceae sp. CFBP 8763]
MDIEERVVTFACQGDSLYGVMHLPTTPGTRAVLVVVGGPQYRAGSHRQFTLLARSLAMNGIAAMRFDYRGMGDSEGAERAFGDVEDDIKAAIDALMGAVPGVREVVLWGLCDGASAAMMYAPLDARVSGVVLLNPWIRTPDSIARTTLRHYYRDRLVDRAFWARVLRGSFNYQRSLASMFQLVRTAFGPGTAPRTTLALPDRMHAGLHAFTGRVLVIISGADLTGREFCDLAEATPKWRQLLQSSRVTQYRIDRADHTFSRRVWRDQVAHWTGTWLGSW